MANQRTWSLSTLILIAFIITNGFGQTDSANDAKPKDSPSEFKSDYITKQIQAADQGDASAQFSLGVAYDNGIGVIEDDVEAARWFHKAADQGIAKAQYNLGVMYAKGEGVIEDYVEAYKWTLLAGMNGKDVTDNKAWLRSRMTTGQIAEGQRLAKAYVAKKVEIKQENAGQTSQAGLTPQAFGTGVFIGSRGWLLTAHHVIDGSASVKVKTANGIYPAKVVLSDKGSDFALLKVSQGVSASYLNVNSSAKVKTGDRVFTVGFPNIHIQGTEAKYTEGTISSLSGVANNFRHFQISTPFQSGNSDGPLVNEQGQVVGIVIAKLDEEAT